MSSDTAVSIAQSRRGHIGEGVFAGRPHVLLERSWMAFKNSAWIAVLSGFFEPVLYLLSFGLWPRASHRNHLAAWWTSC